MAGPEGCFFAEKVTKDVSKKISVKEGLLLHISHACLDHASKGPVSLYVNNGGEDYVICTLKDYGHASLDLNFSSSFVLKVKGEGKNPVHVSGYWEFVADPEMGMMEEDEEEEEEEEEVPAPKAVETKKSPKAAAKEAPKAAEAKKSPKQAVKEAPRKEVAKEPEMEDEEDLESLTPSALEMLNNMMEEYEEFEEEEDVEEEDEVPAPVPVKKAPAPAAAGKKRPATEAPPAAAKKPKVEKKAQNQAPPKKQQQQKQQQQQQQKKGGKKGGRK